MYAAKRPLIIVNGKILCGENGSRVQDLALKLANKLSQQHAEDGWNVYNVLQTVCTVCISTSVDTS